MYVYLINKLQTIKWNCQQTLLANCWKSLTFPTGETCWCVCACTCVYVCVCVCAWQSGIDLTPHREGNEGVGRLAWLGQMTHAVHRVRRALSLTVCADCYRCCGCGCCCCRSRSCGDLKSTFKAERDWKSTWNLKPMSLAALPPVAPYQSCTALAVSWTDDVMRVAG